MSTAERRAYVDAWHVRSETGDASPEVLTRQLRDHEAPPVWLDPRSRQHAWLFDCWDRGITPTRINAEVFKQAGSVASQLTGSVREFFRVFR